MVPWMEFAAAEPEMAAAAKRLMLIEDPEAPGPAGLAYLATVRPDGGPRVHPISPAMLDQRLYAFIVRSSPKSRDLRGDPRYALHSWPKPFPPDGGFDDEEFYASGTARLVSDETLRRRVADAVGDAVDTGDVYELHIERALHKTRPDGRLTYRAWRTR